MPDFVRVAAVSEIPDPGKIALPVGDAMIALFHVGGQFYALDDVCTHDDGPLAEGTLCGMTIACPRHGAKFDIRTGAALTMPARKPTRSHAVEVRGDEVFVKVEE